jgi:hypothetical protein
MNENDEKQKEKLPSAKDYLLLEQIIMLVKSMDCEDFAIAALMKLVLTLNCKKCAGNKCGTKCWFTIADCLSFYGVANDIEKYLNLLKEENDNE